MRKPCAKFNPRKPHESNEQNEQWLAAFMSNLKSDNCLDTKCREVCNDDIDNSCTLCLTTNNCSEVQKCLKCGFDDSANHDLSKIFGCTIYEHEGLSGVGIMAIIIIVIFALGFCWYRL